MDQHDLDSRVPNFSLGDKEWGLRGEFFSKMQIKTK